MHHPRQPDSSAPNSAIKMSQRPKNLNLLTVKFPMAALMSVGHRASGILLFLCLPYCLYVLQLSLSNEAGFELAKAEFQTPVVKFIGFILIWALVHHIFAGIRYFLLDIDIGINNHQAQNSAKLVMIAGFLVSALISLFIFL